VPPDASRSIESMKQDAMFVDVSRMAVSSSAPTPAEKDKDGRVKKVGKIPGKELAKIKRGAWSLGLQFTPDGRQLAMGKNDGTVQLWNLS